MFAYSAESTLHRVVDPALGQVVEAQTGAEVAGGAARMVDDAAQEAGELAPHAGRDRPGGVR